MIRQNQSKKRKDSKGETNLSHSRWKQEEGLCSRNIFLKVKRHKPWAWLTADQISGRGVISSHVPISRGSYPSCVVNHSLEPSPLSRKRKEISTRNRQNISKKKRREPITILAIALWRAISICVRERERKGGEKKRRRKETTQHTHLVRCFLLVFFVPTKKRAETDGFFFQKPKPYQQ